MNMGSIQPQAFDPKGKLLNQSSHPSPNTDGGGSTISPNGHWLLWRLAYGRREGQTWQFY